MRLTAGSASVPDESEKLRIPSNAVYRPGVVSKTEKRFHSKGSHVCPLSLGLNHLLFVHIVGQLY